MSATLPINQKHDIEATTTRIECEYAEESDVISDSTAASTAQDSRNRVQEETNTASISFLSSSSSSSSLPSPIPFPPSSLSSTATPTPPYSAMNIAPSSPLPPMVTEQDAHAALSQEHSQLPELEVDMEEISFTMMDKSAVDACRDGSTESDPIEHSYDHQQQQQLSNVESHPQQQQQQLEQSLHQYYYQCPQDTSTNSTTYHHNPHHRPQSSYGHSQPPSQQHEHSFYPYHPSILKSSQLMTMDPSGMFISDDRRPNG